MTTIKFWRFSTNFVQIFKFKGVIYYSEECLVKTIKGFQEYFIHQSHTKTLDYQLLQLNFPT